MSDERFGYHFGYELWMLEQTLRRLVDAPREQIIINALFESYCIHARALFEFFDDSPYGGKQDKSSLYVVDNDSYKRFPKPGDRGRVDALNRKLNKQIAHLDQNGRHVYGVAERISEAEMLEMYRLLQRELINFKSQLRPEFKTDAPPDLGPPPYTLPRPSVSTAQSEGVAFVTGLRTTDD